MGFYCPGRLEPLLELPVLRHTADQTESGTTIARGNVSSLLTTLIINLISDRVSFLCMRMVLATAFVIHIPLNSCQWHWWIHRTSIVKISCGIMILSVVCTWMSSPANQLSLSTARLISALPSLISAALSTLAQMQPTILSLLSTSPHHILPPLNSLKASRTICLPQTYSI